MTNYFLNLNNIFNKNDFNKIKEIAILISENNGSLYLVGGSVRDIFMNKKPNDYDFCVVGLTKEIFENLFPNAIKQGKNFPVYILENHEFALARKEFKTGTKHTEFEFDTTPNISIYDDLKRRDLTINSIAINILSSEIIDPFNGISDIDNRILRMTSQAFSEDPLRVYRVARFSSQLNFNIDDDTLNMMRNMKNELPNLSVERVFGEFRKALNSYFPANFFEVLKKSNCLDIHFKDIYNLIGVEQPLRYHPEGDAYNHTIEVLKKVSSACNDELIRFGALVHDFGKTITPKDNWPHHYNHEDLGIPIIKDFCKKLKMPSSFLKAGTCSCQEHMLAGIYQKLKPGTKIDLFERVYKNKYLTLEGLEIIVNGDKTSEVQIKFATIGNKIMKDIKLSVDDLAKINSMPNQDKYHRNEKIKQILKEKRIRYLLELENKFYT